MQAHLHGHVHHQAAKHEGRVSRGATDGEGPATEQTQRLHDVIALGNVAEGRPSQSGHGRGQRSEQGWFRRKAPTGDGDDSPKEKGRAGVVIIRRFEGIQ